MYEPYVIEERSAADPKPAAFSIGENARTRAHARYDTRMAYLLITTIEDSDGSVVFRTTNVLNAELAKRIVAGKSEAAPSRRRVAYDRAAVEKDLIEGMAPPDVAEKHGIGAANAYLIRKRLEKEGRLVIRRKREGQETTPPAPVEKGRVLTEREFNDIKRARNDIHFNTGKYAEEHGLDLQQVNNAVLSHSYDYYRRHA